MHEKSLEVNWKMMNRQRNEKFIYIVVEIKTAYSRCTGNLQDIAYVDVEIDHVIVPTKSHVWFPINNYYNYYITTRHDFL